MLGNGGSLEALGIGLRGRRKMEQDYDSPLCRETGGGGTFYGRGEEHNPEETESGGNESEKRGIFREEQGI